VILLPSFLRFSWASSFRMASSIFRHAMKRQISPNLKAKCMNRNIHASAAAFAPFRQRRIVDLVTPEDQGEMMDATPQDDDSPSAGHLALDHYREVAYYLRLIEHDMPRLVAFRKDFVPPDSSKPVIVRSVHYAGEEHPVTAKRVIVVPVGDLPLRNEAAVHKIKVLAGTRWTPQPPTDAGASGIRGWGEGFIKISCERFPEPAMNLKWASDVLDRLVVEANVRPFLLCADASL
jgi:small subunit ribosomal protein S35